MNVEEIQQQLRHFAYERNWNPYHTPKNLTMALVVEAAELVELYQWHKELADVPPDLERVQEELADVLIYALRLADVLDIDLESAILDKIEKNGAKYPPRPDCPSHL